MYYVVRINDADDTIGTVSNHRLLCRAEQRLARERRKSPHTRMGIDKDLQCAGVRGIQVRVGRHYPTPEPVLPIPAVPFERNEED